MKRVSMCVIIEWYLDKIKFTDCRAHSGEGLEMRVLGNVTLTAQYPCLQGFAIYFEETDQRVNYRRLS